MEIRRYLAPALKWWWLILAATLLSFGSAYYATGDIQLTYSARTTLLIGRAIFDPNPSSNEIGLNGQLAQAYADIVQREPVQNGTKAALGLSILPDYKALANGQIVEITVTDTDPVRAQAVANELARQLILLSPGNPQSVDAQRQAFVQQQLQETETNIKDAQAEIANLQSSLGQITSATTLADTQNQIKTLQEKITTLQTIYANLLSTTQQGASNTLSVLEPAALPERPIGLSRYVIIALAALSGLVLAGGAAYLLEYFNDTLEGPEDISSWLKVPVLGSINEMDKRKSKWPYVVEKPLSLVAESFRTLRANIEFLNRERPLQIISICSSSPSDGKTSTAINLAIVMARAGKKVLLVDADLRKPTVHHALGIPNRNGLSEVLLGYLDAQEAVQPWEEDNLGIITAGNHSQDTLDYLNVNQLNQLFARLRMLADVVIVDGPPFFTAETMMLASKADGVLLVARPGHSRKPAMRAMIDQLTLSDARIIGVAANRVRGKQDAYGYGYGRYGNYLMKNKPAPAKSKDTAKRG